MVSRQALLHNYKLLQSVSNKRICAVLKANAYGHNAKCVCKILSNHCDFFAVENLYEAIAIRKVNKTAKILILGYCIDYNLASKFNISVMIDSESQVKNIIDLKTSINVHIKINTGMNRLGVNSVCEFKKILKLIKNNKNICFEGVFTHIFDSKDKIITQKQLNLFKEYVSKISTNLKPIIHIGGSNLVNYSVDFVDYIRCGISLYGYAQKNVLPCMKIRSKVVKIFNVKKGEFVGYDCFYRADKDIKVAIIPIGYADGIIRSFQQDMYVYYKGKKIKIIGKICMDMFMVDVSNINIKCGDFVTVFDNAEHWSKNSGLSEYEILTNLNNARANIVVY